MDRKEERKNISFYTNKLIKNSTFKVLYTGEFFKDASNEVFIHYGFGKNWNNVNEIKMKKTDLGYLAEIEIKDGDSFNFCFRNNKNKWDNNNSQNYVFPIEEAFDQNEINKFDNKIQELKDEQKRQAEDYQIEIGKIKENYDKVYKSEIGQMKKIYENKIDQMKESQKSEIDHLSEKFEKEISQIKENHKTELSKIKQNYAKSHQIKNESKEENKKIQEVAQNLDKNETKKSDNKAKFYKVNQNVAMGINKGENKESGKNIQGDSKNSNNQIYKINQTDEKEFDKFKVEYKESAKNPIENDEPIEFVKLKNKNKEIETGQPLEFQGINFLQGVEEPKTETKLEDMINHQLQEITENNEKKTENKDESKIENNVENKIENKVENNINNMAENKIGNEEEIYIKKNDSISLDDIDKNVKAACDPIIDNTPLIKPVHNELTTKFPENTLIISTKKNKVLLPYKIKNVKKTFEKNKEEYSDIEDVVKKQYVVPYSRFNNLVVSRFREAYNLVRNKEHGSFAKAFGLGMELVFNYNLHPAVISACRNLDELDIYLDYLSTNETEKFNCFDIKYEVPPMKKSK